MIQENRPKVGIGVLVIKDDYILLGKRKGSHGSGEWAPPGGHLELLETPEECAYRELMEETGVKASYIYPGPWTNNIFDHEKHYITLFMFVRKFSGTPEVLEPHKCESWEWFEWSNLPHPLFSPIQTLIKNIGIDMLKNMPTIKSF